MLLLVMIVHILSLYFIDCPYIVSLHATWGRVKLKAKTEKRHRCVELLTSFINSWTTEYHTQQM